MEEENKTGKNYQITPNVIKQGMFLGRPVRNWIEGVVFAAIVLYIINDVINFTSIVKTIASITYGTFVFVFGLTGIKNRSVTQIIIAEIRFRKGRRKLHLRGPEYKRQKKDFSSMEGGDMSIAERAWEELKQRLIEFAKEEFKENDI